MRTLAAHLLFLLVAGPAPALAGGMTVALVGDLGAGKTTLARGVLRASGWPGAVKSPTYTLVEPYSLSSLYFYHFDFYRFADPQEWETAGLADCFRDDAVCLIEWPERVADLLPAPDLELALSEAGSGRLLTARATTPAGERCLNALIEFAARATTATSSNARTCMPVALPYTPLAYASMSPPLSTST